MYVTSSLGMDHKSHPVSNHNVSSNIHQNMSPKDFKSAKTTDFAAPMPRRLDPRLFYLGFIHKLALLRINYSKCVRRRC